jgi:hypothetical protein
MKIVDHIHRSAGHQRRRGLTLVEGVVSVLIVGLVLVTSLSTLGWTARARHVQAGLGEKQTLAIDLMTEILQARYEEPGAGEITFEQDGGTTVLELPAGSPEFGPEDGEDDGTRLTFDDVDDYDQWQASPPQRRDGTALPNKDGWKRKVFVQYVDPLTLVPTGATDSGLKRITITVTDDCKEQISMVALRSKVGVFERSPAAETTYVSWVGLDLLVGDDATRRIVSGASLLNEPLAE